MPLAEIRNRFLVFEASCCIRISVPRGQSLDVHPGLCALSSRPYCLAGSYLTPKVWSPSPVSLTLCESIELTYLGAASPAASFPVSVTSPPDLQAVVCHLHCRHPQHNVNPKTLIRGAYIRRKRFAGAWFYLYPSFGCLNTGNTRHITKMVGIDGEKKKLFTEEGSKSVQWTKPDQGGPLTWYKGYFDAPEGDNPVAIVMTGMGKGMVWINGRSIGRYWNNYLSPLKKPTQSEYHIPRAYLKPKNLIVLLEEEEGNPKDVHIVTVNRDTICSAVSEIHPPSPRLFETKNGSLQPKVNDLKPKAELICPGKKQIVAVEFASYGDPFGACGAYFIGNCTAPESKQVVEKYCLGKPSCQIPLDSIHFSDQNDACTHLRKTLAVQVKCA
ncbi:hypothetical protein GOBAR_DD10341 [Gossypium barbadense]|nr:hypothetical protein GOBAR_DD10341 [Gossypium barbadense]